MADELRIRAFKHAKKAMQEFLGIEDGAEFNMSQIAQPFYSQFLALLAEAYAAGYLDREGQCSPN